MKIAKDKKLLSRGLTHFSKRSKNKFLSKALGIGGTVAGALGFERAMVSRPPNQSRGGRRRASPAGVSATSGVSTVGAGNAPVAFARTDELRSAVRFLPGDTEDSVMIHAVEQFTQAACLNLNPNPNVGSYKVSPTNPDLFPWLSAIARQYQRYRLKFLRLHFQHYSATDVQSEVMLQYYPDPDKDLTGITAQELKECSNFMTGAGYEDFCHTADLTGLDPSKWYDSTNESTLDDEQEFAGKIAYITMNPSNGSALNTVFTVGNIWIEALFHLKGRQNPIEVAAVPFLMKAVRSKDSQERRLALCLRVCKKLIEDTERKRTPKAAIDPLDELEKMFPALTLGKEKSTYPIR